MLPPLLNIKNFIRLDGMQNLVLPNELYVNCYGYVKTPLLTDSSNKIATTEWVKQTSLSLGGFTTSNLAEGTNLYWTDARFDTRFSYKSTSDLQEGINLYFTNARARAAISLTTIGTSGAATYDSVTGVLNIPSYIGGVTSVNTKTGAVTLTTSDITEGTNLYYTDARAISALTQTLTGYVPYTGATGNVNLGWNDLYANNILVQPAGYGLLSALTKDLTGSGHGVLLLKNHANGWLQPTYLSVDRTYTLPDESGTIALMSHLMDHEVVSNKSTDTALGTSNTLYPTQLAVKTYVDSVMTGGMLIQGDWNASTNSPNLSGSITTGYTWRVSAAGTTNLGGITVWNVNDLAVKTASGWIKIDNSSTVQSVFGRQGIVTAAVGDYHSDQVTEGINNLYFTTARARSSFTAGTNISVIDGVITNTYSYSLPIATVSVLGGVKIGAGVTITSGVISVSTNYEAPIAAGTTTQYWRGDKSWQTLPIYTLSGLGGVPTSRTLTINGTVYDLSADRTWTINSMVYPSAGIAVSTGTAWGTSIIDNSTNWNSAYTDRMKWDGGSTGLVAATGRTSLGLGTAATANTGDFAAASHTHSIANVTGLQTALDGKEASITAGTTAQYWRGDKTWQTLTIYSLPIASATVLGGIKVGTNLSIDANGVLSSTDTNTTYVNFTRTASGLVPNPGAATTNRYLREDGTWVIPPDNDTVYTHPTTAGNKHIPAGGATGQILRWSADGTAVWGADTDTWNANSKDVAGYVSAPGAVANKVWKTDALGNPGWRDDADTDTNTWNANSKDVAGYVSAPGAVANKVWKTDASGNPGWRDDADTDTNTTYSAGAGLTLTGTTFSVTKTITASETADTIALRNSSGQLVATGFYQASSRELKTNITPFTRSALDIIRDVTIVSFNYKTDVINKHIGFIAEDTPEELSTRQQNVMDSNNTIGVLLKAIQELENRIKILESK